MFWDKKLSTPAGNIEKRVELLKVSYFYNTLWSPYLTMCLQMKRRNKYNYTRLKAVFAVTFVCFYLPGFTQNFSSVTEIEPLAILSNTGEKPQSKVWHYDQNWWAALTDTRGTYIFKLISNRNKYSWKKTLKISDSGKTHADCKLKNNLVHILLFDKSAETESADLISVEYDNNTQAYKLWKANKKPLHLSFENNSVETATIDVDSKNNMWIAYEKDNKIIVRRAVSPYTKWSNEILLFKGVKDDDICSIVHFKDKIGVLWSNQHMQRFGFRFHEDNSALSVWSDDEIPGNKYALEAGHGMSDDHINLAVSKEGKLYCAVKTSYDLEGYAKIGLLVREENGNWSKLYNISETGTRPIVVLNEAKQKLKVIYSSKEAGGDILYRESELNQIRLGEVQKLIEKRGPLKFNNASSTKNSYSSKIVILASSGYWLASVLARDE